MWVAAVVQGGGAMAMTINGHARGQSTWPLKALHCAFNLASGLAECNFVWVFGFFKVLLHPTNTTNLWWPQAGMVPIGGAQLACSQTNAG